MASKRKMDQKGCEHCDHCQEQKRRKKQGRSWTHNNGHSIELKPPVFPKTNMHTVEDDNFAFGGKSPDVPGWDLHLTNPFATTQTRLSAGTKFRFYVHDIEKLGNFLKDSTKSITLDCLSGYKEDLEIDGKQISLITEHSQISVHLTAEFIKEFVQYLYDLTKDEIPKQQIRDRKERPKLLFQDKQDLAGHDGYSFASEAELFHGDGGGFDFDSQPVTTKPKQSSSKGYIGGGCVFDPKTEKWVDLRNK